MTKLRLIKSDPKEFKPWQSVTINVDGTPLTLSMIKAAFDHERYREARLAWREQVEKNRQRRNRGWRP